MEASVPGKRIVIVGGGIAGLSAAYAAQEKGKQLVFPPRVTLLEAGPRLGGKIQTERVDGFVIEGGPDTFLATKPWAVSLCKKLGLETRLHGTNPDERNTYVLRNGRLHPLPDGLAMMVPTKFAPMLRTGLLSWTDKLRMGMDLVLPPGGQNGDESLGEFISRRLGRATYENLIEPLMSGIYAGDGDQLSLQSTFSYLREMELKHGGLVRGALSLRIASEKAKAQPGHRNGSRNRSIFLTPTTGLAEIVEALGQTLKAGGARLLTGVSAERLVPTQNPGDTWKIECSNGETFSADGLVLATPAFVSAGLLQGIDPCLAQELAAIPYVSTATVSLAYRQSDLPRRLDGYGYVIPRREGRQALACTWTSTKFPHRTPQGYALLRVFVGRAGQEDQIRWDEDGLLQVAREEIHQTLGIQAEPVLSRVYLWEKAMPQYNLGHPARLDRIASQLERLPGLYLAGNGYRGIGIPDCIRSGEEAVDHWLEWESNRQAVALITPAPAATPELTSAPGR
jgi:oxygen-dependent protoporphyrinogen oxidase